MAKVKDKKRILKAAREKQKVNYKGIYIYIYMTGSFCFTAEIGTTL